MFNTGSLCNTAMPTFTEGQSVAVTGAIDLLAGLSAPKPGIAAGTVSHSMTTSTGSTLLLVPNSTSVQLALDFSAGTCAGISGIVLDSSPASGDPILRVEAVRVSFFGFDITVT